MKFKPQNYNYDYHRKMPIGSIADVVSQKYESDPESKGQIFNFNGNMETISVNPEEHPSTHLLYARKVANLARGESGYILYPKVPKAVFEVVKDNMKYSKEGVRRIFEENASYVGQEIEIGKYMREGVGVCRHQAVACASLLSMFRDKSQARWDISVEKSVRFDAEGREDPSGHAWVRLVDQDGKTWIIDVAQDYFGTLEESTKKAQWNYLRPEERAQRRESLIPKIGAVARKYFVRGLSNTQPGRA